MLGSYLGIRMPVLGLLCWWGCCHPVSLPDEIVLLLRPSLSFLMFILFPICSTIYSAFIPAQLRYAFQSFPLSYHVAFGICLFRKINTRLFLFSSFSLLSLAHSYSLLTQITWLFTFPNPLSISSMLSDSRLYFSKLEVQLLATSTHLLILSIVMDWSLFNSWFPSRSLCS